MLKKENKFNILLESLYDDLNVKPNASQEEITQQYKKLVKDYSPENPKNEKHQEWASGEMETVVKAYKVLGDEQRRKEYDQKLNEERENQKNSFSKNKKIILKHFINNQQIFFIFLEKIWEYPEVINENSKVIQRLSSKFQKILYKTKEFDGNKQLQYFSKKLAKIIVSNILLRRKTEVERMQRWLEDRETSNNILQEGINIHKIIAEILNEVFNKEFDNILKSE